MLFFDTINEITVAIVTIVILVCSIGIVIAVEFQKKQKKKYKECLKLIKDKETGMLNIVNGFDPNQIKNIDNDVDTDKLMCELYDTYLIFVEKVNKNENDFDNILTGFINDFYRNKVEVHIGKKSAEIVDNIELIGYSILEYNKEKLTFRVNITCFSYKKKKEIIVSGSNLERVEQIILISYVKRKNKWLINNIEKAYEKKLNI